MIPESEALERAPRMRIASFASSANSPPDAGVRSFSLAGGSRPHFCGGDGAAIRIRGAVERGEFVRKVGSDLCAGQSVLSPGGFLSAGRQALLLSAGVAEVSAHRFPRCGSPGK